MRDDVADLLPGFDVFCLSSRFEGLPLAMLEAMATGVPVVATAVGGIPEVVTDGVDGLLVPAGDPSALATAIGKILDDDALAADLATAGRTRAASFGLDRVVARTEALYAEVAPC
jgi:glycosyltransferase involved in cell wall biosynthesis